MKYDLEGQIRHKIEFIEKFVPKHVKVTIIGYSLGTKITLRVLEHPKLSQQISKCYLLFPTIERIDKSSAGARFPILEKFYPLIRFSLSIFHLLPIGVKRFFTRLILNVAFLDVDNFDDSLLQATYPTCYEKTLFLYKDAYLKIRKRDDEIIERNLHKLKFYYGTFDEFVRKKFYYDLIENFPGIDAELCTKNYPHTFILRNSIGMAEMICNWIKEAQ